MKRNKLMKTLALTLALTSLGAITPSIAKAEGQAYWTQSNSNWYYIDSTGKSTTGWINDNGNWYYLGSDGVMKTGWIYDNGNWYYSWSNGQMATDTTIDGYYVNGSGAWSLNKPAISLTSNTALTADDIDRGHTIRGDISSTLEDMEKGKQLSSNTLALDSENEVMLESLSENLAQGRITLSEAKSSCIGKVVNSNYRITNITFLDEVFPTTIGSVDLGVISSNSTPQIARLDKVKTIKESSLYSYVAESNYKYDKYLVFTCGNARGNEWEGMRIVIEFEAL